MLEIYHKLDFIYPLVITDELQGIRRSELVDWYLVQVQDTIDTEQELIERKAVIDKVIDRLIYKVISILFLKKVKNLCF